MLLINVLVIVLLIALTGFFVATEFAIVKVRTSRIEQLMAEGKKGDVSAIKVVNHLDEYLSACQLGITEFKAKEAHSFRCGRNLRFFIFSS